MPPQHPHRLRELRAAVQAAWIAGLRAVDPEARVSAALSTRPDLCQPGAITLVVAVGKAAAPMLRGAASQLPEDASLIALLPSGGDAGELPSRTVVLRGGHPHPTEEGMLSTQTILRAVDGLGAGQHLLFLLSGGASALLEAPAPGLDATSVLAAHRALVSSGWPIDRINRLRGCLSAVKAGRLAQRAFPAAVTTLAVSDVEGDDPAVIGSGPTWPPRESLSWACRLALESATKSDLKLPEPVWRYLREKAAESEPRRSNSVGAAPDYTVVASVALAVDAAAAQCRAHGMEVGVPATTAGTYLRGSTEAAAERILAELSGDPMGSHPSGLALVFGGETTVTLSRPHPGKGGRNLDLAARLALAIRGRGNVAIVVAGTDGCDGSSRAAGAIIDGGTAERAEAAGRPLPAALAAFDTEPSLEAAGDLLVTGPTGTNVGDLVVAGTAAEAVDG